MISESELPALLRKFEENRLGVSILPLESPATSGKWKASRHPVTKPYTAPGGDTRMNKTEGRFAAYLNLLRVAGEISEWWFEDWTFRLADGCRYTPDFVVLRRCLIDTPSSGSDETEFLSWDLYDVKGRSKRKNGELTYWAEEDAKIKIKMAAKLWPMFNWYITYPLKNGEWAKVLFRGDGAR